MNKRIRKKHLKRTVNELVAIHNSIVARAKVMRERSIREAYQDVIDARGKSHEEHIAAIRRFMETISLWYRVSWQLGL